MRTRLLAAFAALLLMAPTAVAAPLALHRGVGVHDLLNWSPLAADGSYRWPPYRSETEWLSEYRPLSDWPAGSQFVRIRALGFDFVRLTVDPGPLLDSSGARRRQALAVLSDTVRTVTAAGLKVVLNLHAVSQVPRYGMAVVNGGAGSAGIAAYRAMTVEVAEMLVALGPEQVAFEPFNEPAYYPCDSSGSTDWQQIVAAEVAAIRAVSPTLTLVVTGACGGSITGLTNLDPGGFDDANILYSFHMYEPHAFTHQRDDAGGWYSGFPWPADAAPREVVLAMLAARMAGAGASPLEQTMASLAIAGRLDGYLAGDWGPARLEARIGEAVRWAERHGIPPGRLFMGEFGAILLSADGRTGAENADRLRYIRAVRTEAERHGIPWSIWEYSNPYGMSVIVPAGPAEPDLDLLDALGLPQ